MENFILDLVSYIKNNIMKKGLLIATGTRKKMYI